MPTLCIIGAEPPNLLMMFNKTYPLYNTATCDHSSMVNENRKNTQQIML